MLNSILDCFYSLNANKAYIKFCKIVSLLDRNQPFYSLNDDKKYQFLRGLIWSNPN